MIYCDTAYLLKFYVDEPDSGPVRELINSSDGVASCSVGRLELASALHRKYREGSMKTEVFAELFRQYLLDCEMEFWTWVEASDALIAKASTEYATIPANVFLRAADALHLACARDNGFKTIYSNDERLLAAAPRFGLRGKNVIRAHPPNSN